MAKKSTRRSRMVPVSTVSRLRREKSKLRKRDDAKPLCFGSVIIENWDPNANIKDNYQRLGLCRDPNKQSLAKIARREKLRLAGDLDNEVEATVDDANESPITDRLLELQANPPRQQPALPSSMPCHEQALIGELVRKYGAEDLEAMAKDRKLNPWQKTGAQLRKRVQLYLHLQQL